ncbi:hypothetical protein DICVIV_00196 [Dictyocaulus viviparus]|uniref:Uncharacterized protein n=1 Tax=Dictyocaulus viviparus TaxID=29172 RepID=A0A0D8YC51_DICVI|nr:hypothetical protein DICVIV_00196 [Dictyocaulus viviparus]
MGTASMILNTQIALIGAHKAYENVPITDVNEKAISETSKILHCEDRIVSNEDIFDTCSFPGSSIYLMFQTKFKYVEDEFLAFLYNQHEKAGWLTQYNIHHNISQRWYLETIEKTLAKLSRPSFSLAERIENEMRELFFNNTVDEFFFSNIDPLLRTLHFYMTAIQKLRKLSTYQRRSFKIDRFNASDMLSNDLDEFSLYHKSQLKPV